MSVHSRNDDSWDEGLDPDGPSAEDLERFGDEFKTCSACGSQAWDQAEQCPACGAYFEGDDMHRGGRRGGVRGGRGGSGVWSVVGVVVLIVFVLVYVL